MASETDRYAGVIRTDPYARHLGIEFKAIEEGHAVTRMRLRPEHMNFLGMVHGGAIFSLADVAFSAASNSRGQKAAAIHLAIDFLAPAGETEFLEADVREVARAGRGGLYEMRVTNSAGKTVAVLRGWVYYTSGGLIE